MIIQYNKDITITFSEQEQEWMILAFQRKPLMAESEGAKFFINHLQKTLLDNTGKTVLSGANEPTN